MLLEIAQHDRVAVARGKDIHVKRIVGGIDGPATTSSAAMSRHVAPATPIAPEVTHGEAE